MFIDFEGIDGSGKTTLSNKVAAKLRKLGYRVTHARESGELQSLTARRVRELTRDSALLEMAPQTEFFLNVARDAQQLDEVIKPAVRRGDVVISDRYLYSQVALTHGGRGVPLEKLQGALDTASQGIWPDLVILVDVEPDLARLRKRVGKESSGVVKTSDSRKGLAGAGLAVRMRESFLAQARTAPDKWLVVENNDQPLWVVEQAIVDAILARLEGQERAARRLVPPPRPLPSSPEMSLEERFFGALEELEAREPQLAVHLLTGLPGLAAHRARLSFAEELPAMVAASLSGLSDPSSHALRRILLPRAPAQVVASLGEDDSDTAMALREVAFEAAPGEALAGLKGNDSERAWALRERALADSKLWPALCGSLARLDTERAWRVRERAKEAGLFAAVAKSLGGLTGERADALRAELYRKDRLAVLRSVNGLDTPYARRVREQLFHLAPKLVLRSLTGLETEQAWELRERAAPWTKEAIDSLDGLSSAAAWALRERYLPQWTATALSSMREHGRTERGQALIERALALRPTSLAVLRNAYAVSVEPLELAALADEQRSDTGERPVSRPEPVDAALAAS